MSIQGNPYIALLILVGMIVIINGAVFMIARGATRSNKANRRVMDSLRQTATKPFQKEDKSLDELRKQVEELEKKK